MKNKSFPMFSILALAMATLATSRGLADSFCQTGHSAFVQTLYPRLRQACTQCHGDSGPAAGHSVSDSASAYVTALDLADFENPATSLFARKVKQKHWLKHDPSPVAMESREMETLLLQWWERGERECRLNFEFKSLPVSTPNPLPNSEDRLWVPLQFELGHSDPTLEGCSLRLDFQRLSPPSGEVPGFYRARNLSGSCNGGNLKLSGVRILVNEESASFENIYDSVTATLGSNPTLLSREILILMSRGKPDSFRIAIHHLTRAQETYSRDPKRLREGN